jgi:hypothetical protein
VKEGHGVRGCFFLPGIELLLAKEVHLRVWSACGRVDGVEFQGLVALEVEGVGVVFGEGGGRGGESLVGEVVVGAFGLVRWGVVEVGLLFEGTGWGAFGLFVDEPVALEVLFADGAFVLEHHNCYY